MDILQLIEGRTGELPESEGRVARTILSRREDAAQLTITRLAHEAGTSTSAVQRLCQSLGFSGYKDFRYELAAQGRVAQDVAYGDDLAGQTTALSRSVAYLASIDRTQVDNLVCALSETGLAICTGVHRSGLPAQFLRMGLEDLGIVAVSACDVVAASHLAHVASADSCAVHFSVAGSRVPWDDEGGGSWTGVATWLVTTSRHPVADIPSDHVVTLPGASPATSSRGAHVIMLAFVEVVLSLVEQRMQR